MSLNIYEKTSKHFSTCVCEDTDAAADVDAVRRRRCRLSLVERQNRTEDNTFRASNSDCTDISLNKVKLICSDGN